MYHLLLNNNNNSMSDHFGNSENMKKTTIKCSHDEEAMNEPFEVSRSGFSPSEINAIADQISTKLIKIVEKQLHV